MIYLAPGASGLAHHQRVFAGFYFYSLVLAALFSRMAEIQAGLGISKATLGLALLAAPAGTQVALIFAGGLVDRLGQRLTVLWAVPMLALGEIAAVMSPAVIGFATCLFLAGLAIGAIEIVLNLEADRAEHLLGRRVMSRAHAFWSFGFFSSGLIGAVAAQIHLPVVWHLIIVDAAAVALLFPFYGTIQPAPARPGDHGTGPRFVMPTAAILLLVVVTLPAMLLEGAGADWSVIYMHELFTAPPFVNGLAFAAGAGFQALARYNADPFVDRYGPVSVARVMIGLLGIGCLMVTLAPWPWMALIGFSLMGIGSSSIFPLAMSAAAQLGDRRAATNVAALAQLSFVVFLLAPPLLGFVAEHLGIRLAFGLGLPLVVVSLLYIRSLAPAAKT